MDENLEYFTDTFHTKLSGSKCLENSLRKLPAYMEARILALVRSANDSVDDVATYKARTHGFFPKASMHQNRVRELLAPMWTERFTECSETETATTPKSDEGGASSDANCELNKFADIDDEEDNQDVFSEHSEEKLAGDSNEDLITKEEVLASLEKVASLLESDSKVSWMPLWGALHAS